MKANVRRIFRIFYRSFFAILLIAIFALIIITPADAIQQALQNNQAYNVFAIAGCYFLTIVFSGLIWTTRWWTNKQALKAIPKTFVPVEKGDVSKKVRKMIVASLSRSATIAWDARPRTENEAATIVSAPDNRDAFAIPKENEEKMDGRTHKRQPKLEKHDQAVTIPPLKPVWGAISHNGWSSPTSGDLPNLQFVTVILELPHLIEARAVSLAPSDSESTTVTPIPDMRAVSVLQRPVSMGLRDYIGHLTGVGVISAQTVAMKFLVGYEYARFSGRPLSEAEFRDLMKHFADLLREMKTLAPSVLEELEMADAESDIDGEVPSLTTPLSHRSHSLASFRSISSRSGSEGTIQTAPSRRTATNRTPTRGNAFSTAPATPATPQSRRRVISRTPSWNNFSQSRRPYTGSTRSSASSLRSQSQGSVIRLSRTNENSDLPYTLTLPRPHP